MKEYKYIFVVLVFRTGQDIPGFINSLNSSITDSFKVIVVNSFYSEESLREIHKIAEESGCDFLSIDNRGYGYGNNKGIDYANTHYLYEHLIVCNADIKIIHADLSHLGQEYVSVPMITTISGKRQNPFFAKRNTFSEKLLYYGFRNQSKFQLLLGRGINKAIREMFLLWFVRSKKRSAKVYAAHGSFLIFPRKVLEQIVPVFDENMFLFYEEAFLADKLFKKGIDIILHKNISILHYEDGSTKGSNLDLSAYSGQSFTYYYETYRK